MNTRSKSRATTTLPVALSVTGVLACFVAESVVTSGFATVGLALIPVAVVTIAIAVADDTDVFSPLHWLLYLLATSVFGKTIYIVLLGNAYAQRVSLDGRSLDILDGGIYAMIIASVAFSVAYVATLGRAKRYNPVQDEALARARSSRAYYNSQSYKLFLIFSLVIASVSFLFFAQAFDLFGEIGRGVIVAKRLHEETVGGSSRGSAFGYLRWGAVTLPQVVVLATVVMCLHKKVPLRGSVKMLLVALAIISVLIPLFTSARLELMYLFVMLGGAWHYYRRRTTLLKLTALGLLLIFVTGALGYARVVQKVADSGPMNLDFIVSKTFGSAYFMDIGKTAVIVDTIPDLVPYQTGRTYGLIFLAPVPRALWPEKPSVRISTFVGDEIFYRPDNAGIPPGFVGEAYMNFGYLGVAGLSLLLGVVASRVYRALIFRSRRPLSRLWYIFFVIIFAFSALSGDFTVIVSQAVRYGLVLWIIDRFLFRRELQVSRAAPPGRGGRTSARARVRT